VRLEKLSATLENVSIVRQGSSTSYNNYMSQVTAKSAQQIEQYVTEEV